MTTWTEERKDELVRLWHAGNSATQIAATLGVTRSMVMGVIYRAGMKRNRRSIWTEEAKARVVELWTVHKWTRAQIAAEFGVSAPAATSIVKRLGLRQDSKFTPEELAARHIASVRGIAARRKAKREANKPEKEKCPPRLATGEVIDLARFTCDAPDPLNLSLTDLEHHHCRWITSDDEQPATYCGNTTLAKSSWCPFHHGVVFTRGSAAPVETLLIRNRSAFGDLKVA